MMVFHLFTIREEAIGAVWKAERGRKHKRVFERRVRHRSATAATSNRPERCLFSSVLILSETQEYPVSPSVNSSNVDDAE
jgi:hypothetical protein